MKEKTEFWKNKTLAEMSTKEWEQLCDGCAKCCLHKLEDEDTGKILYTRVACRLLDLKTCRCSHYARRHQEIQECAHLAPENPAYFAWLPETCAYRRIHEGRPLPDWHPLQTGTTTSVLGHRISDLLDLISESDAEKFLDTFPEMDIEAFVVEGLL